MKMKIKKLNPEAKIPTYQNKNDAGLDLIALTKTFESRYIEYGTGLAIEIPEGNVGLLFPRSSISEYDMSLANCVGVIDSGYRGEIKLRFKVEGPRHYELGDRIGQLVILPFHSVELEEVEDLTKTERSEGGFGSTGE